MGLPARKPAANARGAGRERNAATLRLVSSQRRPVKRAASGPAEAACRSAFQVAMVALVALTCLGLARVALSARVAEASIDQLQLERSIKAENRVGDKLELDRSLLVTPSRIESLAADLDMTQAPAVRYLAVPETAEPAHVTGEPRESSAVAMPDAGRTLSGMLSAALDVTEKEARTLLVGDAVVAASR